MSALETVHVEGAREGGRVASAAPCGAGGRRIAGALLASEGRRLPRQHLGPVFEAGEETAPGFELPSNAFDRGGLVGRPQTREFVSQFIREHRRSNETGADSLDSLSEDAHRGGEVIDRGHGAPAVERP